VDFIYCSYAFVNSVKLIELYLIYSTAWATCIEILKRKTSCSSRKIAWSWPISVSAPNLSMVGGQQPFDAVSKLINFMLFDRCQSKARHVLRLASVCRARALFRWPLYRSPRGCVGTRHPALLHGGWEHALPGTHHSRPEVGHSQGRLSAARTAQFALHKTNT